MARLIDYLNREGIVIDPENNPKVIVADSIQKSLDADPRVDYQWTREDFICVAPPYECFFVEAKGSLPDSFIGIMVYAASEDTPEMFKRLKEKLREYPEFQYARWIYICHVAVRLPQTGAMFTPIQLHLAIGHEGQLLTDLSNVLLSVSDATSDMDTLFSVSRLPLLLKTLNFLNLVNVELVNVVPPAGLSKRNKKKYGVPLDEYKELVVRGKTTVNLSRSELGEVADRRAHEVRGHIKRRKTGNFYWHPHIRGVKEKGEITKSYRVQLG